MKKNLLLLSTFALCATMHAGSYAYNTTSFRTDSNLDKEFDLDHHYAYTWGISSAASNSDHTYNNLKGQLKAGSGWSIESVTLTFEDIWDWIVEPNDRLWVNLLDTNYTGNSNKDLKKGVTTFYDNKDDIESTQAGSNYFNNKGKALGYWTDLKGGNNGADKKTVTFTFNATQISALCAYINNGGATSGGAGYADFGFAFDPDCHYYNTGIELKVVTKKYYVPDGGVSAAFLGAGLLALAGFRRRSRC